MTDQAPYIAAFVLLLFSWYGWYTSPAQRERRIRRDWEGKPGQMQTRLNALRKGKLRD